MENSFEIMEEIAKAAECDIIMQKIASSIAKRENFDTYEVIKVPVTTKGAGYLAITYMLDIKGKTKHGREKETNLFLKFPILESTLASVFSTHQAYANECFMYKELAKIFEKLQDSANIPAEKRFKMIKGFDETSSAAVVLQNVSRLGFKSCNRMEIAKVKFVKLALEQLARLHALGFVMQKEMPEYFNRKIQTKEHLMKFSETWKDLCKPLLNISIKSLNLEARKKAEDFVPVIFSKYEQHIKDTSLASTICHGDFRANNLMFKEVEGEITELIPIDYQTIHYGCPVNDILHIIYGCTDQEFRNNNKLRLINFYYKTLEDFLKCFSLDVNEVYPRKEFDKALLDRRDYGLMVALFYYPTYFAKEDDVPDVSQDLTKIDFDLDVDIVKRIEEIIDEYYGENV